MLTGIRCTRDCDVKHMTENASGYVVAHGRNLRGH